MKILAWYFLYFVHNKALTRQCNDYLISGMGSKKSVLGLLTLPPVIGLTDPPSPFLSLLHVCPRLPSHVPGQPKNGHHVITTSIRKIAAITQN